MSSVDIAKNRARSRSTEGGGHTLVLEEAHNLPVFWSGSDAVPKLVYKFPPGDPTLFKMTISEVLEKFCAQDYIRNCRVSLAVSPDDRQSTLQFAHLRMSDNFSTLWLDADKKPTLKLVLDASNKKDASNDICTKYLLILSEMNKKRVMWDGRRPVSGMIARITELQMFNSIETVLRKYMALDYLRNFKIKLELVITKNKVTETHVVNLEEKLASLFSTTSASLRISLLNNLGSKHSTSSDNEIGNGNSSSSLAEILEKGRSSEISVEGLNNFWLQGNWQEVRVKVQYLLEHLELLRNEREIPPLDEEKLLEERALLTTAMRRRNKSVEEIWRLYEKLKLSVDFAAQYYNPKPELTPPVVRIRAPVSVGRMVEPPPPSDSAIAIENHFDVAQTTTSCIDMVAQALRGMGVEILDEDQRVSPAYGIAITMAVVVAVCVVSHIVSH